LDLFICTGELSGDLHGAALIEQLLKMQPALKIGAVAGPKMREFPITTHFRMEELQVMGFSDVFFALPKLIRLFYSIRNKILSLNPKAVVFIDYPGLHLRLQQSLRKKNYRGKLIHMPCPSVWAWGKKRIPKMAANLDLLLTFFPFEKNCFSGTTLPVETIGHPVAYPVANFEPTSCFAGKKILALFPGSRRKEIDKNLPLQLQVARKLKELDPSLTVMISAAQPDLIPSIPEAIITSHTYDLMRAAHLALATSGTATLELALHGTPTIVHFAIKPFDCFLAQKIFRINLPFYSLPNLILQSSVFPELFGPHFTYDNLLKHAQTLWFNETARSNVRKNCETLREHLPKGNSAELAAKVIRKFV
jgi:lipid-A-disaccharide synthase